MITDISIGSLPTLDGISSELSDTFLSKNTELFYNVYKKLCKIETYKIIVNNVNNVINQIKNDIYNDIFTYTIESSPNNDDFIFINYENFDIYDMIAYKINNEIRYPDITCKFNVYLNYLFRDVDNIHISIENDNTQYLILFLMKYSWVMHEFAYIKLVDNNYDIAMIIIIRAIDVLLYVNKLLENNKTDNYGKWIYYHISMYLKTYKTINDKIDYDKDILSCYDIDNIQYNYAYKLLKTDINLILNDKNINGLYERAYSIFKFLYIKVENDRDKTILGEFVKKSLDKISLYNKQIEII